MPASSYFLVKLDAECDVALMQPKVAAACAAWRTRAALQVPGNPRASGWAGPAGDLLRPGGTSLESCPVLYIVTAYLDWMSAINMEPLKHLCNLH